MYESLWCLLGLLILHIVSKKAYKFKGQIFSLYIIWYGAGRFVIEGLRTDSLMLGTMKRVSQLVAIVANHRRHCAAGGRCNELDGQAFPKELVTVGWHHPAGRGDAGLKRRMLKRKRPMRIAEAAAETEPEAAEEAADDGPEEEKEEKSAVETEMGRWRHGYPAGGAGRKQGKGLIRAWQQLIDGKAVSAAVRGGCGGGGRRA